MILVSAVATLCAIILAHGLKTGNVLVKYGTASRRKEPILYWFAVGTWSFLLVFMLFLAVRQYL